MQVLTQKKSNGKNNFIFMKHLTENLAQIHPRKRHDWKRMVKLSNVASAKNTQAMWMAQTAY